MKYNFIISIGAVAFASLLIVYLVATTGMSVFYEGFALPASPHARQTPSSVRKVG